MIERDTLKKRAFTALFFVPLSLIRKNKELNKLTRIKKKNNTIIYLIKIFNCKINL